MAHAALARPGSYCNICTQLYDNNMTKGMSKIYLIPRGRSYLILPYWLPSRESATRTATRPVKAGPNMEHADVGTDTVRAVP
jgi:hypothetical protein